MSSRSRILVFAGVSAFALVSSELAFAVSMGSVAPHDPPAGGQASEQWVTDPRTQCIAGDPSYTPGDSISWQGKCRKDGVIYGPGTLIFLNGGQVIETVTGIFADGLLQPGSIVTASWADGTKYQGGQLGGLFDGAGKFVSAKGEPHDGEWKMGVFQSGKAGAVWPNGDRYDGEWKNGKPDGEGVEVWADGRRYEGQWHDGVPVGDVQSGGNPGAGSAGRTTASQPQAENVATAPQAAVKPASLVASPPPPAPALPAVVTKTAVLENKGNAAPNPALPLRAELDTVLAAVDGATLELELTHDGFERTLVLPNGNSQEIEFAFANGPVGTVSDGEEAIGVFRAKAGELDIDYADGTTETLGEATNGGLLDHTQSTDGHAMCTNWYPQGHVFSQGEKQAAVQEYASRLGLSASAPASKQQRTHDGGPACGGAFIASGSQQRAATTDDTGAPKIVAVPGQVPAARGQLNEAAASGQHPASPENGAVAIRTAAVQLVDRPGTPAQLESASFVPDRPAQTPSDLGAAATIPSPQPGASDCLSVTSNGEYWGFQNRCGKSVQFAYCEMGGANPLTSCNRTSVGGSVAANGFSALVSDRSLMEKNATHEFRWMACDGGAGEVVPHLDRFDPPSGRCERALAPAE